MESITSAAEEVLVDSLSFKLPGSGQYVQERRSVTFHTEGSNSYSAQAGTRVIRFKLATEGWMDPSTARFFFDVVNNDPNGGAKHLRPGRGACILQKIKNYDEGCCDRRHPGLQQSP